MTKRQSLSIATIICYLITIAAGLLFAFNIKNEIASLAPAEGTGGIGTAIAGGILAVILILAYVYAVAAVLPLLLKIINIFVDSSLPAVIAMLFDIIYILVNVALLVNAFINMGSDGTVTGIVAFAALLCVSITALVTNVVSMFD